jgi:hypothetical protein
MTARLMVSDPPADEPIRLLIAEPRAGAVVCAVLDRDAGFDIDGEGRSSTEAIPVVDQTAPPIAPVDVPLGTWFG